MGRKNIEIFLKENLEMFPHLKAIRNNLWARDGKSKVSVMVGAGFSVNANKVEENFNGMALWNDLKGILEEKLSHHRDIKKQDILKIAEIYEDEYGRASLEEILKEAIPDENYEPSEIHYDFLNLPWADIYTTNYDTLLERARSKIYERKYQVIYDIKDIPNSTSPRIIKLHGSFPSNRPFIFSEKDYKSYPFNFSPFVNMVQQSIMETTFILIGFSGEDPNFEKWITWVRENLGEQMPKIYMLGYDQNSRMEDLKTKGITLIDFKGLYEGEENPYSFMFKDIFNFFSYKEREEKTKWPYKKYAMFDETLENFKYNREHYPGWIVIPNSIRSSNVTQIRNIGQDIINSIGNLEKENLEKLNEILWCYKTYHIPLETPIKEKLIGFIDDISEHSNKELYQILWFLLHEARLNCNEELFAEYKNIIENCIVSRFQKNEVTYEEILFNLELNNINKVKERMDSWKIKDQEIEWALKKAIILLKVSRIDDACELLEKNLQRIRLLLSIENDNYKLLSLESIALYHLGKIKNQKDYGYDRLRSLNIINCDMNKEFDDLINSIKLYDNRSGTRETEVFDLGKSKFVTRWKVDQKKELLDSYAALNIREYFNLSLVDNSQYDIAINNLKIWYSNYFLIKKIHLTTNDNIDHTFSRPFVYNLKNEEITIIYAFLKKNLERKEYFVIGKDITLEIISRIYALLSSKEKIYVDDKIMDFLNEGMHTKDAIRYKDTLNILLTRIVYAKNHEERKIFYEKLFEIDLNNFSSKEKEFKQLGFFEPFLAIFFQIEEVRELSIPKIKIVEMLNILMNSDNDNSKETALIRLTFLNVTKNLPDVYKKYYIECLTTLNRNKKNGLSDYIFENIFEKIISGDKNSNNVELFLTKDIPKIIKNIDLKGAIDINNEDLESYLQEIESVFPDYIRKEVVELPENKYYRVWLNKFYIWWENQKSALLRNNNGFVFQMTDYLKKVVIFLKNNIFSIIPIEILDTKDNKKIYDIFNEINHHRSDLSLYLLASLDRLNIETNYSLKDILQKLKTKKQEEIIYALDCLYDYLVLMNKEEIKSGKEDTIINELFNILYYCSGKAFKAAIGIFKYTFKNIPSIFSADSCRELLEFLNNYLELVKHDELDFKNIEDFDLISDVTGLVAYLSRNEAINIEKDLAEWSKYIQEHKLPEVRKYKDILIEN